MRRAFTRISLGLGSMALVGSLSMAAAGAAPSNAKNAFIGTAHCGAAGSYTLVVNNANGQGAGTNNNGNQAEFAPAHLTPGHLVFHPTTFDVTFTFTPASGPPQSFTNTDSRKNQAGDTTCVISGSQTDGVGDTFSVSGSVIGTLT